MITNSVVKVGDGRGFVVEGSGPRGLGGARYIITAGHCLRELPPCHGMSYTGERTYEKLLAQLGRELSVSCECLFVDPIADIAVLGMPDEQELSEEAEAYEALVEAATPLIIAEPPGRPVAEQVADLAQFGLDQKAAVRECPARILSLDNQWFPCRVTYFSDGMLRIENAAGGIMGGMSGSPIITEDDKAIGVVCIGSEVHPEGDELTEPLHHPTEGGPNPRLMGNLPGWFLKSAETVARRRLKE